MGLPVVEWLEVSGFTIVAGSYLLLGAGSVMRSDDSAIMLNQQVLVHGVGRLVKTTRQQSRGYFLFGFTCSHHSPVEDFDSSCFTLLTARFMISP